MTHVLEMFTKIFCVHVCVSEQQQKNKHASVLLQLTIIHHLSISEQC